MSPVQLIEKIISKWGTRAVLSLDGSEIRYLLTRCVRWGLEMSAPGSRKTQIQHRIGHESLVGLVSG